MRSSRPIACLAAWLGLWLSLAAGRSAAERIDDAKLNFAFNFSSAVWTRVPPTPNENAQLVLTRRSPVMRFHILAKDSGAPAGFRDEDVLARAIDAWERRPTGISVSVVARRERRIAGVQGVQITNRLINKNNEILYDVSWFGCRAGIIYWLSLISQAPSLQSAVDESAQLFEGFSLLDTARTATPNAAETKFHSERFGYLLDLGGTGLAKAKESGPKRVEFFATLPGPDLGSATLMVIPVFLSDLRADPDLADASLCAMIDPNARDWTPVRNQDAEGVRIREYEGTSLGSGRAVTERARIFQRDHYFIAVSVTALSVSQQRTESLLDVVSKVRLDPAAPATFPSPLTPAERLRQQLFLNALGLSYTRAARVAEAVDFLERADALESDDPTYARNLAEARLRAGRPRDAARGCDEALKRFPQDPALFGFRGIARAALRESEGAAADFRRAYELGNVTDDVIVGHSLSLAEQRQFDAALAVVDGTGSRRNDVGFGLLRAVVLHRAGRRAESLAALKELLRDHPNDLRIQSAMVSATIEQGDPRGFLEATDDLVSQSRSALLLYLRAIALRATGRADEAIAALEQAEALAPGSPPIRALRETLEADQQKTKRGT
jgi:tetratricopeptide (TPR) repeat protein